jgi:hypothetical protein
MSHVSLAVYLLGAIAWTSMLEGVHATQTNVTALCSPSANPPLLKKGATTYVCINVNDNYRAVFTPVADKFTVLRVTDCTVLFRLKLDTVSPKTCWFLTCGYYICSMELSARWCQSVWGVRVGVQRRLALVLQALCLGRRTRVPVHDCDHLCQERSGKAIHLNRFICFSLLC